MKTNYIDSMPEGKEIDALIAEKVMGWERYIPVNRDYKNCIIWDTGSPFRDGTRYTFSDISDINVWQPSTNIAAAWEIVEKMEKLGYWWEATTDINAIKNRYTWCFTKNKSFVADADSVPLAICRAVLLTVE